MLRLFEALAYFSDRANKHTKLHKYLRSNLRDSETYSSLDYMLFGQTE